MTDSTAADRSAWRTSVDYRDEETRSDALARAAERNAGWIRFATLMLVIYGITLHGSRGGTRFYTDRA